MEEIDLKDMLDFFIHKLGIIILITLLVVLVGSVYSLMFVKSKYQATATLLLTGDATGRSTNVVDTASSTLTELNVNSKIISTYREIIKSKTVLKDVINTLNLDYTTGELAKNITVENVSDADMLSITVSSMDAKESANIANELAQKFIDQIKIQMDMENIKIMDKADIPSVPTNVNIVKQVIIYTLIGLVLSCAIVFVIYYLDNTLKDAKQVEKLGLTVLTSIPQDTESGVRRK